MWSETNFYFLIQFWFKLSFNDLYWLSLLKYIKIKIQFRLFISYQFSLVQMLSQKINGIRKNLNDI